MMIMMIIVYAFPRASFSYYVDMYWNMNTVSFMNFHNTVLHYEWSGRVMGPSTGLVKSADSRPIRLSENTSNR